MDLDFNFHRNKKTKEHPKTLNLKWNYSLSKGFYIGFKAIVAINFDSIGNVSILIHFKAPNDVKILMKRENLQKRRIIQKGDIIIFDKGYYIIKTTKQELTNTK